jgi:plasmid stabilization system protein ParE
MEVRISNRAKFDLDLIFAFIFARQGSEAAERFLELARETTRFLLQHPLAGPHPKWAARHKTLRFWVLSRTNFVIYYIPDQQGVSIERVLDGRRDVARVIELGMEEPPD